MATPDSDTINLALGLGSAVVRAILAAIPHGHVSTLDALRPILKEPSDLALLDEALIAAQRAKAASELHQ